MIIQISILLTWDEMNNLRDVFKRYVKGKTYFIGSEVEKELNGRLDINHFIGFIRKTTEITFTHMVQDDAYMIN